MHWLNVVFVSARRDIRSTESAVAVYGNEIRVRSDLRLNIGINPADIAAVAHIRSTAADSNHVVGVNDIIASSVAYCDILGPCRVCKERAKTNRCIAVATDIVAESIDASGRIKISGAVVQQRESASGSIV